MRRIWRGLHYSDKYGSHPGAPWVVALPLIAFVAGLDHGLVRSTIGAVVMLVIFGPLYLYGAYERGDV